MSLEIAIREKRDSDEDLIYNSWIKTLQDRKPFSSIDRNWFTTAQHGVIQRLLRVCDVWVACQPEDPDQVYGYMVVGPGRCLHWIYTKGLFRQAHVATRLLRHAFQSFEEPIEVTIETPALVYHKERWNLVYKSHRLCEAAKGDGLR